ncbi:MAG TPA: protein kinase [Nannocystis sp.]
MLARIFTSADELRRWLCMRLPDIYADLPGGNASLSDLAYAAQGLLERTGMIDDELLDALADFSPAHGPAVVELSKWLGRVGPPAPPPRTHAPTASVLATLHPLHAAEPSDRREIKAPEAKSHAPRTQSGLPPHERGQVLGNGRYVLRSLLGRGGFATVWRARDTREGRDVAVKLMHPQDAQDVARRERFFRGARAMQHLQHPAIVRVLDPRAGESPQPFFVMEIVEGTDLHEALAGKPHIDLHEILDIACTIGEALAEAHLRGMVHRDIKPANILIDRRGAPHLTDFDLVRARGISGGTRTGGMGTVLYAAPELVQNAEDADARADIYGLGMTVLFMLFGNDPPYKDIVRSPEAILASVACPPTIKRVVLRAIDWDREQRFPDVGSFCAALRDAGPHPRQHVPPRPTPQPQPSPALQLQPVAKSQRAPTRKHTSHELWGLCSLAVATVIVVLALGPTPPGETVPGGPQAASGEPSPGAQPPLPSALPAGASPLRARSGSIADAEPRQTTGLPAEVASARPEPKSSIVTPSAPRGITRPPKISGPHRAASSPPPAEVTETAAPIEPPTAPPPKPSLEELIGALEDEIKRYGDSKGADCLSEEIGLEHDKAWAVDAVVSMAVEVGADGRIDGSRILGSGEQGDLALCMVKKLNGRQLTTAPGSAVTVNVDFGF